MRRLAAVVILVAVLGSAPAASSRPHVPATNGWIVFASTRSDPRGFMHLHRLEPIGGRVTQLGRLQGQQPAWSPDGSLLAYVDHRWRVVVARSDGRILRVLTKARFPAQGPTWSPDGSRLAFSQSGRLRFRGDIVVAAVDGSSFQRITSSNHNDLDPAWSPDGSLIAFVSDRPKRFDDHEILVVRPDGRGIRALTSNAVFADSAPAWSPDGSRIAFVSGRNPRGYFPELWTMRSDGTDERRVPPTSGPEGFPSWSDTTPMWSPDGNWLAYVTNEAHYPDDVFIVRPDGTDKVNLTPESPSSDWDPAWQPVCSHPGTGGRDQLRGTLADDRLCGFGGPDVLSAGAGRDGLYGGDGNDVIRARDRSFDVVGCGPGRDEVVADRVDLIGVDCERVRQR